MDYQKLLSELNKSGKKQVGLFMVFKERENNIDQI